MVSSAYRFGVEEEYFLSDAESRGAVRKIAPRFIEAAQAAFPEELQREMLQSQIEVATLPIVAGQQPVDIARRAVQAAKLQGFEVLLLDTAGSISAELGYSAASEAGEGRRLEV